MLSHLMGLYESSNPLLTEGIVCNIACLGACVLLTGRPHMRNGSHSDGVIRSGNRKILRTQDELATLLIHIECYFQQPCYCPVSPEPP